MEVIVASYPALSAGDDNVNPSLLKSASKPGLRHTVGLRAPSRVWQLFGDLSVRRVDRLFSHEPVRRIVFHHRGIV